MSNVKNRYEFLMHLACTNANPNGDPDMANAPRMDPDTMIGYITDGAIKRRIRDYVAITRGGKPGMDIFVKSGTDLNATIAKGKEAAGVAMDDTKTAATTAAARKMCELFYDVRTFGAVMASGPKSGQARGPVQVAFAESLDPIQPQDTSITRVASAELKGKELKTAADYEAAQAEVPADELRTIGRKQFIPFGLYRVTGFVSANFAERTGFSEEDLDVLFEALANIYDTLRSASKGHIAVVGPVVIFKHVGDPARPVEEQENQAKLGRAPAHKLFELVSCAKKPGVEVPRSYRDYDCAVNVSGLPDGVEVGFRAPFADGVVWGQLPDGEDWMVQT